MKTEEIKALLERYYRGETTLPEEQQLKSYFQQNHVPDELEADRETFRFLSGLSFEEMPLPPGLEERLSSSICRWEKADTPQARPKVRRPMVSLMKWSTGIAAALVIAAGAGWYALKANDRPRDTFDNPELAYIEAQRALQLFAAALDKGQSQVSKAESQTLRIREQLEKCCNTLADDPQTKNNDIKK